MYSKKWTNYLERERISRIDHIKKCWSIIWFLIQMSFGLGIHSFAPRYFQNDFKIKLHSLNTAFNNLTEVKSSDSVWTPSSSLTNTEDPPRPWDFTMVWKEWNTSFRYMKVRSTDMERRKVYQPNTNTSLNRKCWNTFTISRTRSERTDGFKEIPQRFPKPRFWGVKTHLKVVINFDL